MHRHHAIDRERALVDGGHDMSLASPPDSSGATGHSVAGEP
jgi:hypothetical protein